MDNNQAKEYAYVLENQTLLQARMDKMEEEHEEHKKYLAQIFVSITVIGKAVQTIQDWIMRK